MAEKASTKTEKSEQHMFGELTGREAIVAIAGGRSDADNRESMIRRAAVRAGISYRQAKGLYYGETKDPRASVAQRLTEALHRYAQGALRHAREEYQETDTDQLVSNALVADAELRSAVVALVLEKLSRPRSEDRPMDE